MIWRKLVGHPQRVIFVGIGGLLGMVAVGMGYLALRDLRRIERVQTHMEYTVALRRVTEQLLSAIVDRENGSGVTDSAVVAELANRTKALLATEGWQTGDASDAVARLRELFAVGEPLDSERLTEGLTLTRDIVGADIRVQEQLLEDTALDTRFQVLLSMALFGGLLVTLLLGGWIVRRRFLGPLDDLRNLFYALADRDFRAVSTDAIDPILVPLFENFNYLVTRLETLEEEHRSRARTLESEVRSATQALLEQHRSLANAERLAAVGELAAGVAHELRNPLAGISMSLSNLRQEVSDPDFSERLDVVIAEIERITRLLEQHLSSARHAPEPARKVDIHDLVADLLDLLQYQVPRHITLESHLVESIECTLPRDRIRQMLLNLVLNSVEASGDAEGRVIIAAWRSEGKVHISVCDDGPGFPEDMLGGRMRAFATRRKAGTGLGLVMVRRVVQELGGELDLSNREPHGACVTLTFPITNG